MKQFQTKVWPKRTAPWRCLLIATGLRPSGGRLGSAGTHPELPALLPHQPAVLDEVHGALVHGAVGLVAQPVLVALRWGRDAVSPSWTWRARPWPRSSACGHERAGAASLGSRHRRARSHVTFRAPFPRTQPPPGPVLARPAQGHAS